MLKVGQVKEIYERKGAGRSIRGIADDLGIARNAVPRYLNFPEALLPKPRTRRASKLDPYTEYLDWRMSEGLENCVVPHRELKALGYDGGYSILKSCVSPRHRRRQPEATMRFETAASEQAQVDWGNLSYLDQEGRKHRIWVFVMTMDWSKACYVELVRRTDTAAFIQCHVNDFEYLGGVPRRYLYDNAKVVTLGRDEDKVPIWNRRMLDFALRVGFEIWLCQPYRAQTKVKVESGVKYVKGNMWPSLRFTGDADLNRQALEWCGCVANRRIHGTTRRVPWEMLIEEHRRSGKLPGRGALAPYLREDRRVARDGFVSREGSRYGVHWKWVETTVRVGRAPGHGGDLGRRRTHRRASQGAEARSTLHPARPVVGTAGGRQPAPAGGDGGADSRRRGGTALPGCVRTGRRGRCGRDRPGASPPAPGELGASSRP